jgi:two-component system, NarL family, response regulator DevR
MGTSHDTNGGLSEGPASGDVSDVSVYVLEGDERVRSSLVELIATAPGYRMVGSSGSASTALREITAIDPDVAVIDACIRGFDALDVCRLLRVNAPAVQCVILTVGVSVPWGTKEAAEAGAAALVLKQLREFPLLRVIAEVSGRQSADRANL